MIPDIVVTEDLGDENHAWLRIVAGQVPPEERETMTDRQPHETVRLTLEIDRRLYDDIRETAKRMGFEVEAWCIAALEVGVEANLPEEAP